jgi:peptidyl-prolyl cis-trans isomerase SurA
MTFRNSKFSMTCGLVLGLGLLTMPDVLSAQAPRYKSPYGSPAAASPMQPAALPIPAAITPNGTVVEDVIVRVNDQIISRSDLERSQQQLLQEMQQQGGVTPAEAADRQKNLLRDMIDQQLLLSRAKELGLNADSEVIRRLDEIRKQNKLDSMEDLEKAARSQGVSFEDFKGNIRNGILTQQVVRDEVGRRLGSQMTQAQQEAYYDAHKQEFEQPEQVRLSEILIPTAADAKEATVAQALAKATDVASKVQAGGKFEELAKTYSGGPTAAQGGDLGLFKRGALAKVLEDKTFVLKTGESTAPIRTRQGFVILKVTEHQDAGVAALKDVEPQVQEGMYMQALQPALRAFLTKLRESAYIDIKPGFVDSGSSAKQTKPIFTAYAAPVVKKKKIQEKQRFDRGGRFSAAKKDSPVVATPAVATPTATSPAATTTAAATPATDAATLAPAAETAAAATPVAAAGRSVKTRAVKTSTKGNVVAVKEKTARREKVRFGQAPRNSLPADPQDTLVDKGLGRTDLAGPGGLAAPGAAIAPVDNTATQFSSNASTDEDPLAPKTVNAGKTRYSSRAKTEAATKVAAKDAKAKEKAIATPVAASADEKATEKSQAAPLGLNGDTAKKKKEKVAGAPKERLQQKPKELAAPLPEATPYRTPKPDAATSDRTTLAPVTAPAPGAPPQGNVAPATPGNPIPTPAPN